jgi:hypothetical protein
MTVKFVVTDTVRKRTSKSIVELKMGDTFTPKKIESVRGLIDVDCRVYFTDDKGEWFPTKKGVTFNDEAIDEVIPLLQKASGATPHPNLGNEAGTEGE